MQLADRRADDTGNRAGRHHHRHRNVVARHRARRRSGRAFLGVLVAAPIAANLILGALSAAARISGGFRSGRIDGRSGRTRPRRRANRDGAEADHVQRVPGGVPHRLPRPAVVAPIFRRTGSADFVNLWPRRAAGSGRAHRHTDDSRTSAKRPFGGFRQDFGRLPPAGWMGR